MRSLSTFVLKHKALVVVAWLLLLVAGFATLGNTTSRLSTNFNVPSEPAFIADSHITALYHSGGDFPPTIVTIKAPAGSRDQAQLARAFAAAAAVVPGSRVADQADTGDTRFRSGDYNFALVYTPQGKGSFGGTIPSGQMAAAARSALPAGNDQVGVTGYTQLEQGTQGGKGTSVLAETMIGGFGALAVLIFVFASFLALMPLVMAIVAIPTAFLLIGGLTYLTPVNFIVEFLVALIGLGVSIDYSLLVVTRWREQRAKGDDNDTAVRTAMESAGRAVVFSGLTVAISLLALVVMPVDFLRNVGSAGFLIPLVSVAVAVTLLPVLLATVGQAGLAPGPKRTRASRLWTAWARAIVRHRALAAVVGTGIALALVFPLTNLDIGEPSTSALATSGTAHTALAGLSGAGIPTGVVAPIEVLATQADAAAVSGRLARVPGVYSTFSPSGPSWHRHGTALVEILPVGEPSSAAGSATVTAVRAEAAHMTGVIGVGALARPTGLLPLDLWQLPFDVGLDRCGHVPPAGPRLPQHGPGPQGRGLQRIVGLRRLRDHGAHLAVGLREPPFVGYTGNGLHNGMGAHHGLRFPLRFVHGL